MTAELSNLIHDMILRGPIPAKILAKQIGKPYSTLLREANPHDGGAKLDVETFIRIIKATGDLSPMEYIARELDFEMVPKSRL